MYRQYIYAKSCSIVHKKPYHISGIFKKLTSEALDNAENYFYLMKKGLLGSRQYNSNLFNLAVKLSTVYWIIPDKRLDLQEQYFTNPSFQGCVICSVPC